jgi:hypothetical protein
VEAILDCLVVSSVRPPRTWLRSGWCTSVAIMRGGVSVGGFLPIAWDDRSRGRLPGRRTFKKGGAPMKRVLRAFFSLWYPGS